MTHEEIVSKINELIDSKIKSFIHSDGGDIQFIEYKEGIVYVKLLGACHGCPMSKVTLKDGIQELLQHYIPEIKSVEQVELTEEEINSNVEYNFDDNKENSN